jgi:hypothetical protein
VGSVWRAGPEDRRAPLGMRESTTAGALRLDCEKTIEATVQDVKGLRLHYWRRLGVAALGAQWWHERARAGWRLQTGM